MTQSLASLWAETFLEEAVRLGVRHIGIAPGARSAALVAAAGNLTQVEVTVHFDERALGFWGVGVGKATKNPALLITTSGTAVANLLPAVVEASLSQTPMLICSADRPHELHDCGANQTIDQHAIFGEFTRWFNEMPSPTEEIPLKYVLSTIDYAYFKATQIHPGPVHINAMFREPILNGKPACDEYKNAISAWKSSGDVFTYYPRVSFQQDIVQIQHVKRLITEAKKGCFIIGGMTHQSATIVLDLASKINFSVFAEAGSGLCLVQNDILLDPEKVNAKFDIAIKIGDPITVKSLLQIKAKQDIVIHSGPTRLDSVFEGGIRLIGDYEYLLNELFDNGTLLKLDTSEINIQTKNHSYSFSENSAIECISSYLSQSDMLFCGNSLAIRSLTACASRHLMAPIQIYTNRGASGIDGNIATIAGLQTAHKSLIFGIIGDQTALHDITSLSLIAKLEYPVCLFILNNYGGQIFSKVIPKQAAKIMDYFHATHQVSFKAFANQFNCNYLAVNNLLELDQFLKTYDRSSTILVELIINKEIE